MIYIFDLSIQPPIHHSLYTHLFIHFPTYPSTYLYILPFINPSIYALISLLIHHDHPLAHPSVYSSAHPSLEEPIIEDCYIPTSLTVLIKIKIPWDSAIFLSLSISPIFTASFYPGPPPRRHPSPARQLSWILKCMVTYQ